MCLDPQSKEVAEVSYVTWNVIRVHFHFYGITNLYIFLVMLAVLGIEPRAFCMLYCSTTELYPVPPSLDSSIHCL